MTSFGSVTPFDAMVTLDLELSVHVKAMSFDEIYFQMTLDLLLVRFVSAFAIVVR